MNNIDLRNKIKSKGLTVEQLADKLGITKRTIYRYLSGSHKIPKKIALAMQAI